MSVCAKNSDFCNHFFFKINIESQNKTLIFPIIKKIVNLEETIEYGGNPEYNSTMMQVDTVFAFEIRAKYTVANINQFNAKTENFVDMSSSL